MIVITTLERCVQSFITMSHAKDGPRKIQISLTVARDTDQSIRCQTRPTTRVNFGSSQMLQTSNDQYTPSRQRKARSASPGKYLISIHSFTTQKFQGVRDVLLPIITLTRPGSVQGGLEQSPHVQELQTWEKMAREVEERTYKAKLRMNKKKAKKAKVKLKSIFI